MKLKNVNCNLQIFFKFQMIIPGDVAEMTEFQEKTMNNSRFILELCFPNVQLVLPNKAFYEKLYNRYEINNYVLNYLNELMKLKQ